MPCRAGGLAREVLILSYELGEPIIARGKPHGQRIEWLPRGRLRSALHHIEAVVDGLSAARSLAAWAPNKVCSADCRSGFIGNRPTYERQRIGVAALFM